MAAKGSLIHIAVRNNAAKKLKELLGEGLSPNAFAENTEYPKPGSREERPPLQEACRLGNTRLAQLLLKAGADKTLRDVDGNTALHAAAEGGLVSLLKVFAKDFAINEHNLRGETPLHRAVFSGSMKATKWLIKQGANLDTEASAKKIKGYTAIHYALVRGLPELVKELLKAKASTSPKLHLLTPLLCPAEKRRPFRLPWEIATDIALILTSQSAKLNYPNSPFVLATRLVLDHLPPVPTELLAVARELVSKANKTTFAEAVKNADMPALEKLLQSKSKLPMLHEVVFWLQADEPKAKKVIELFVNNGVDIDGCDNDYGTGLHAAIGRKSPYFVKVLLSLGASLELWTKPEGQCEPQSPLTLAVHKKELEIVDILLNAGAVVDDSKLPKFLKRVPLSYIANWLPLGQARSKELIEKLLSAGADPNFGNKGKSGTAYYLPLEWAVNEDDVEAARVLFAHGAHFRSEKVAKEFLKRAQNKGSQGMLQLLNEHGIRRQVRNIFDAILVNDEEKVRKYYPKSKDRRHKKTNLLPLEFAVKKRRPQMAELLISLGAKRDPEFADGMYLACMNGVPAYVKQCWQEDDKDLRVFSGNTLLHQASFWGHSQVVETLLSHGLPVDITNEDGETPLFSASYHCQKEVIQILIENGANASVVNLNNCTVLHRTIQGFREERMTISSCKELLDFFIKARAPIGALPVTLANIKGEEACSILSLLVKHKADLNLRGNDGRTPLHAAAHFGHAKLAEALLAEKVDTEIRCEHRTALHFAAKSDKAVVLRKLLQAGAKINPRDLNNLTPLDLAASKTVRDLLRKAGGQTGVVAF